MKIKNMIALVLSLFLTGCGTGFFTYSSGSRVGVITKFSHKGFICKTWEGQLAMQNFHVSQGDNGLRDTNTFNFSVPSSTMATKVQQAMDSGKPVRLLYHQRVGTGFCTMDTDYEIVGVKYI